MSQLCKTWLVGALIGLSTAVMAQTPSDPTQLEQAQSIGTGIGKPLGMLLFGYVVLRLFNRPRDGEDTGKPWRIGALVLVLLFMLGLWWSR